MAVEKWWEEEKSKEKRKKGNECMQQWGANAWVDYIRGSVGPARDRTTYIDYYYTLYIYIYRRRRRRWW